MSGTNFSRRSFLSCAAAWAGSQVTGLRSNPEDFRTVSILHTTDLHGHILPTRNYDGVENLGGFARCATMIRNWRRQTPHTLLIDNGDVYQGTAASHSTRGELMMRMFNRLGYDAWTLGNHDFDWGPQVLRANLAHSQSPVLGANLTFDGKPAGSADGEWRKVVPWIIRETGGFRIAIIGVVTPGLPFWLSPETLGGAGVLPPGDMLKRCLDELRAEKPDAIVVSSHMGWRQQDDFANPLRKMLRTAPGADVLLAGHSHQDQPSWNLEGVLCSQASYHGIHCGRVDLTFDLQSRKLVGRIASTVLMDASHETDPAVLEAADPELKSSRELLARKIGHATREFSADPRNNEVLDLFCQCFREALEREGTKVDGVFHGTFGTGSLPAGDITIADCWRMLPYENLLVTAEIGASEILEIFKEERENRGSDRVFWPFDIQMSRSKEIVRFDHQGAPVDPDARFTIAFNSYDSQSGGRSMMRLREILMQPQAKRRVTSIDTRGALIDGILNRKTLS